MVTEHNEAIFVVVNTKLHVWINSKILNIQEAGQINIKYHFLRSLNYMSNKDDQRPERKNRSDNNIATMVCNMHNPKALPVTPGDYDRC